MNQRPISQRIRLWLMAELGLWRSEGILSEDQAGRILALYETEAQAAQHRSATAIFALCGIAALMVGLAVLLVVGYNWQAMPAAMKLTVLFGSLVGSFAAAMGLRYAKQWRLASEIVLFLSGILYGTSIWLIAQTFNIQSHYPNGFLFWALGLLPIVLALDTVLLHALYAVLLAAWVAAEILGFPAFRPLFFSGWMVPNGAYALPLLVLPGMLWAYRKRSLATVAVYVPLVAWWAVLQPAAWHNEEATVLFVGMVGALLLLIAEAHRRSNALAIPYRIWGILITAGALIPLSYADVLVDILRRHAYEEANDNLFWSRYGWAAVVLCLVGLSAIGLAVWIQCRRARLAGSTLTVWAGLRNSWLPNTLIVLFAGLCCWVSVFQRGVEDESYYWRSHLDFWSPEVLTVMLLVNAMMVVFAVWLMRRGLRNDSGQTFAFGVLYFLLWTLLRYVDLFADIGGMLGAASMFLLCGVGLFACARFWHQYKGNIENDMADMVPESASLEHLGYGRFSASLKRREPVWLALGLVLQLAVLGGMIAGRMAILHSGETVLLRVAPVDPRDLFRGDYVTLGYDFSRVPEEGIPGLGKCDYTHHDTWAGRTVYIALTPEEDGKHYRANGYSLTPPKEGKYLRGELCDWGRVQCGIEAFYVQEGNGLDYEQAARNHTLTAEIALTADGQAALRGLMIDKPAKSDAEEK